MSQEPYTSTLSFLEQRELSRSPKERRRNLLLSALLPVLALVVHGPALWDGLFLQDHAWQAKMEVVGLAPIDHLDISAFELPGHLVNLWWQGDPIYVSDRRPVGAFIMHVEHLLARGNPAILHLLGILWHGATGMLVFHLARWMTLRRRWSLLAGALFIINPQSAVTVGWITAHKAIIGAFFFCAAVLSYAHASAVETTRRSRRSHRLYQAGWSSLKVRWYVLCLACWAAALLSHKAAIIFPLVAFLLDFGYGGGRLLLLRLPTHGIQLSLAGAYVYWLYTYIPGQIVRSLPWVGPTDIHLVPWMASKLLHSVFSVVTGSPMFVGIAHIGALARSQFSLHMVMAGLTLFAFACYEYGSRELRCRLLWPVWFIAAPATLITAVTLPQYGYLAAAAWVIMLTIIVIGIPRSVQRLAIWLVIVGTFTPLPLYRTIWRGVLRHEQLLINDLTQTDQSVLPGSKVFFINLPPVGLYATFAMRHAWDLQGIAHPPDLEGYVLTFASTALGMEDDFTVEQLNDHEILVGTAGRPFFADRTSRTMLEYVPPREPLTEGTVFEGEVFDTTIVEADEAGVRQLKFSFLQPLSSRHYLFYASSRKRPAARLTFRASTEPIPAKHGALFTQARSEDARVRAEAKYALAQLARPVAIALGSPIQAILQDRRLTEPEALDQLETWWQDHNVSGRIAARQRWLKDHAGALAECQRFYRILKTARAIVHSDLFLTGLGSASSPTATQPTVEPTSAPGTTPTTKGST